MRHWGWVGAGVVGMVLVASPVGAAGGRRAVSEPAPVTGERFSPAPVVERLGVPSQEESAAALRLVQQVYAREYAVQTPEGRQALAARLLEQADQSGDVPAARYVMLLEAGRLAATAGDASLAMRSADRLGRGYRIDELDQKVQWLAMVGTSATGHWAALGAEQCLLMVEEAIEADAYAPAERLLTIAQTLAQRGKAAQWIAQARQWREELHAIQSQREHYEQAQAAATTRPEDPLVNSARGEFLCLVKGDWKRGLPLLVQGGDAALKRAAEQDLLIPREAPGRAAVGHLWWALAEQRPGMARRRLQERAEHWYRQARPGLEGLSATLVDQRLAQLEERSLRRQHLQRGLLAQIFADAGFGTPLLQRVDRQIDFDFGEGAPADGVPRDDFSISWTGWLRINQAGSYTFVVIANSSAKLTIDRRILLDEPDLTRKRTGARVAATFDPGMYSFRFDFSDHSGVAKARLLWIPPGEAHPVPVPPEAFAHDR